MKFYMLDGNEKILCAVPSKDIISLYQNLNYHQADTIEGSLVLSEKYTSILSNVRYFAISDRESNHNFYLYRKTLVQVQNHEIAINGQGAFWDEMQGAYIKDKRPNQVTPADTIKLILSYSRWNVDYVDQMLEEESLRRDMNFYYVSLLDALNTVYQTWQVDIEPYINIEGHQITRRYVKLYQQQGGNNGRRFVYGDNALTVTQQANEGSIFTALVGRGAGVEETDASGNLTGGYSRKISFADVEWSKANGDPCDKPKGQEYVEWKESTELYGYSDGKPRIGIVNFDNEKDPAQLLKETWAQLQQVGVPLVQFQATVGDVGYLNLGETVTIVRYDLNIKYQTRVTGIKWNRCDEAKSQITIGVKAIQSTADKIAGLQQSVAQANVNADEAKSTANHAIIDGTGAVVNYGPNEPTNPKEGDIWYDVQPDGTVVLKQYQNGQWVILIDDTTGQQIKNKVEAQQKELDKAVQDANAASAKADGLVAQVGDANTNAQKALTTAQQNQADLAQAKNDLENTKNQLTNVQSDLTGTKSSLAGAISNISQAQSDLTNTKQGLQVVKSDLANTKQSLANDEKSLSSLSQQAQQQGQTIVDIQKTQSGLSADIADVKGNVSSLQDTADGLQATVGTLNSDNLISNSDCLTDTPGVAPDTDWKPAFDWLYSDGNFAGRAWWYGYSALQLNRQIASNWAVFSAPVKSGKPNQDTDYAFNVKFYITTAATYDVFLECGYTKEFKTTKDIKLGTLPVDKTGSWQSFQATCTVPRGFSWVRLKITSSTSNPYFWIAQPMLSYGTTQKPYVSSNYPAQKMASISETVDGIKATVSDNANGISQIKQTAQNIESDVANNKNDISSIKQTADSLKSSIQDDEKNISSLQQTAQGLQGSISDNKNDIANIKATAQGLQSSVQDNKKNISTIQQQAGTIESAISTVNSDNLVPNSDMMTNAPGVAPNTDWKPAWGWLYSDGTQVGRANWYAYSAIQLNQLTATKYAYSQGVSAGKTDSATDYAISVKYMLQNTSPEYHIYLQAGFDSTFTNCKDFDIGTANKTNGNNYCQLTATVNVPANMPWVRLKVTSNTNGYIWIAQPMIVYGTTIPTQYISSNQPGQKMSSIKQTIDSIQSTVQSNTGQISQVKQTADSLQSSITQGIGSYLLNGNFDDNDISKYWVPWDTTKDLSEISVGDTNRPDLPNVPPHYLRIATKSSENKTDIGTKDFIPVNVNEDLEIKAWSWLSAKNGDDTAFQFYVHSYDKDNNEIDSWQGWFKYDNLQEWEQTDVSWGSDSWNKDTVSIRLEIVIFGGGIDTFGAATGLKIINGSSGIASQFTQTIDSLTSKIADADGNISQLKQTSDSLTSQIGNANNDISSLKQRADSMESNISDSKNDISDLKQTASSLQSNIQSKTDISQFTQLSNAFQTVVQNIGPFYPDGDFSDVDLGKYYDPWDTCPNLDNLSVVTNNKDWGYYLQIYTPHGTINKAITKEYLPINAQYSLTFKGKSLLSYGGKLNGSFMVYMHFFDSNKNAIQNQASYYKYDNNNVWQDFSLSFTPPSNAAYVRVETVLDNSKGDGVYWGALDNLSIENGEATIASKISQMSDDINLRVQKGDLLSQINIQAGSTLIQSKKLFLDASSVVFSGNAFIPSAAITDLSADKITAGTLNAGNVNIINLDVNKLVGNTTEFVRSGWTNAYGSHVQIDGGGMSITYGDWSTTFNTGGVSFNKGNEQLGGFTSLGMAGQPDWFEGTTMYAGGNAEYLAFSANDYNNTSQSQIPIKAIWLRNEFSGAGGYNSGWNFCDDVWAGQVGMSSIQYGDWNIHFEKITGNDGFSALTLVSGSGDGFYWGSDGSFGYVTNHGGLHNVRGSQIVYDINQNGGTCQTWSGVD